MISGSLPSSSCCSRKTFGPCSPGPGLVAQEHLCASLCARTLKCFLQCLPTLGRAGPAPWGPLWAFCDLPCGHQGSSVHMGGSRETLEARVCHLSCCHWRFGCPSPWGPIAGCSRSGGPCSSTPQNMGRGWSPREGRRGGPHQQRPRHAGDATAAVNTRARVGSAGGNLPSALRCVRGTASPRQLCLLRPQPPPPRRAGRHSAGPCPVCS